MRGKGRVRWRCYRVAIWIIEWGVVRVHHRSWKLSHVEVTGVGDVDEGGLLTED